MIVYIKEHGGKLKVHHLDCGTMCPCSGFVPKSFLPQKIVCHCFLIETNNGLVLIDTGLGQKDINNSKLGPMSKILGVNTSKAVSAIEHVIGLGFSPKDVTHIIPTHLDFDHAGGIVDFPRAKVHISRNEFNAAFNFNSNSNSKPNTNFFINKQRYKNLHNNTFTKWQVFDEFDGESWFGFKSVRDIKGLPPEILLIPLFGHSDGQVGVALYRNGKWLLHCGDAYYDRREIIRNGKVPLGWKAFEKVVNSDYDLAMKNQNRLSELYLQNENEIDLVCAHDAQELIKCQMAK